MLLSGHQAIYTEIVTLAIQVVMQMVNGTTTGGVARMHMGVVVL